ncbi:hypothetical protein BOX15_Mlig007202g1, partial [Macrostomum lignano]
AVATMSSAPADSTNPHNLACQYCGSLILQAGVATICPSEETHQLPAMHAKQASKPSDFPLESCPGQWWCVLDMMQFENIGFTNTVDGLRYLICADCEKGPVGLVQQSGSASDAAAAAAPTVRHLISEHRVRVLTASSQAD